MEEQTEREQESQGQQKEVKYEPLEMETQQQQHQGGPMQHTFGEMLMIFIFETIGTGLFAYGIVCSRGSDVMISMYLFAAIFITCKFTGGHVNPAVSFSFYCDDTINATTLKVYWTAQLLGAFGGAWLAYLILEQINSPHIPIQSFEWMLADLCGETLGTFLFVLFIHIQVHEQTRLTNNDIAGIGLIVTGLMFSRILTFHSGGCLNPAMGISLELFQSIWEGDTTRLTNFWVFLIAPLFGGYLAQLFYGQIYLPLLLGKKN